MFFTLSKYSRIYKHRLKGWIFIYWLELKIKYLKQLYLWENQSEITVNFPSMSVISVQAKAKSQHLNAGAGKLSWKLKEWYNTIFSTFRSYLALYHTKLSLVKIFNSTNSCWMWHKALLMCSMQLWDQSKKIIFLSNIFTKLSLINIKNQ